MRATDARLASASPAARPVSPACAHCGLPVPAGRLEPLAARQFCCEGCRTVWTVIHDSELGRFYSLRETAGPGRPARPGERTYEELDDAGFLANAARPGADGRLSIELFLEGVHCGACVWLVERLPRLAPGVDEARLDVVRARLVLGWDPRVTTLSAIARRLDALGYRACPVRGQRAQERQRREDRVMLARIGLAGAVAANVMAIAFALYGGMLHGMEARYESLFRWASLLITTPSFVWGGGVFFRGAWAALRARALHMDLPISLGLAAGFAHGLVATARGSGEVYFDSISALVFLLLVGRYVQRRQQRAAADAAELLAALAPRAARLLEHGQAREVPLEALRPGQRVEVRAGDLVPADGVVARGHSSLDLAWLTGESRPVAVGPGDRVHAGTVNLAARLEVSVERTGEDTRAGRLMKLVEEHARRRAPVVQLADRLAGAFVAIVLGLAAATLVLWLPRDSSAAVNHAVALLVVTCPCALGLATPLALSAAVGQGARAGFLIRGADVLESLTRPGRWWLDKTGTLTEGRAALRRWVGDDGVRPLVAAAESQSAHPVARALVASLGASSPAGVPDDLAVEETRGGGVAAHVHGHHVLVGSPAFVTARVLAGIAPAAATAVAPPPTDRARWQATIDEMTAEGLTPVLVAVDGRIVAAAGLGDALREDAGAGVARLRARGWRVGILSGDHPALVSAVGRQLGLPPEVCLGGVGPEAKLRVVSESLHGGAVVMAGDGVNDAAALAAATVGIAVHGGAEAALEAADVFVTRPGVARLADLVDGAHRTLVVVRRNLAFSLAYNVVGVALAMAGVLNPLLAAILMPLSSITVITSSYRARTFAARGPAWR